MRRLFLFIAALACTSVVFAADYANVIVPRPVKCRAVEGEFILTPKTVVRAEVQSLVGAATIFSEDLAAVTGSKLAVKRSTVKSGAISLALESSLQPEEYRQIGRAHV